MTTPGPFFKIDELAVTNSATEILDRLIIVGTSVFSWTGHHYPDGTPCYVQVEASSMLPMALLAMRDAKKLSDVASEVVGSQLDEITALKREVAQLNEVLDVAVECIAHPTDRNIVQTRRDAVGVETTLANATPEGSA